jgi:drug/metabolite transporter (DMT)-like permease
VRGRVEQQKHRSCLRIYRQGDVNPDVSHGVNKNPALRGGLLALLAATLFGLSTPLVQRFGQGLGAFSTAALLYAGAAFVALWMRQPVELEAKLKRADLTRLLAMAGFGAVIGPVALAWGLQRTSGTSASLMLTLEALFTVVLAWRLYGESMDKRVASAMLLLLAGGMALVADQGLAGNTPLLGLLAVLAATAAWGLDNTLSRGVADRDPAQVVIVKSALGASASTVLALIFGESLPSWTSALALFAVGALGYGLSLRFYLLAQRAFGAARTGSVFAFAPFIGAMGAFAFGDRSMGWIMLAAGGLMLAGVALHLMESHVHSHMHEVLAHEHAHSHDLKQADGHHMHTHDVLSNGSHNHPHKHEPMQHAHPHVPDVHHGHAH